MLLGESECENNLKIYCRLKTIFKSPARARGVRTWYVQSEGYNANRFHRLRQIK